MLGNDELLRLYVSTSYMLSYKIVCVLFAIFHIYLMLLLLLFWSSLAFVVCECSL